MKQQAAFVDFYVHPPKLVSYDVWEAWKFARFLYWSKTMLMVLINIYCCHSISKQLFFASVCSVVLTEIWVTTLKLSRTRYCAHVFSWETFCKVFINLSIFFFVCMRITTTGSLHAIQKCLRVLDTDIFLLSNNYPVKIKPQQQTSKKCLQLLVSLLFCFF